MKQTGSQNLWTKHRLSGAAAALRQLMILTLILCLGACAQANAPKARNVNIPTPTEADARPKAVNEKPDSILYLPLGGDALLPEVTATDALPKTIVGPFELRAETLAGALQLILADYNVPLAFQTDDGLNRRITVANLKGPLDKVIEHVCGLANLYCAFEDGMLTVKDTQTFTVRVPPISQDTSFMDNIATGLAAIIGKAPIVDRSTRTIIYEATNRNAEMAERYFQRMRSNTALIVFETYIWEVSLNAGNSTGINWDAIAHFGKFSSTIGAAGAVGADFSNPISIGLPTTFGSSAKTVGMSPTDVVQFLSTYGAVKTISQPQITVLSGSQAKLRAADKQNYVSKVAETLDNGEATTSVDTDSVDTGFTITIDSAWDNATVYAAIALSITDVASIENFTFSTGGTTGGSTIVQLPKTTEREVNTQVRIRPGDSLLIAGLVRENDNLSSSGPGVTNAPTIPTSRTSTTANLELVIMLRPRVVVFTSPGDADYYKNGKAVPGNGALPTGPATTPVAPPMSKKDMTFNYDFAPLTASSSAAVTPPARVIPPKAKGRTPLQDTPAILGTTAGNQMPSATAPPSVLSPDALNPAAPSNPYYDNTPAAPVPVSAPPLPPAMNEAPPVPLSPDSTPPPPPVSDPPAAGLLTPGSISPREQ